MLAHSAPLHARHARPLSSARPAPKTINSKDQSANLSVPSPAPPAMPTTSVSPVSEDTLSPTLSAQQTSLVAQPTTVQPVPWDTPSVEAHVRNAPHPTANAAIAPLQPPANSVTTAITLTWSTPQAAVVWPVTHPANIASTLKPVPHVKTDTTCKFSTTYPLVNA